MQRRSIAFAIAAAFLGLASAGLAGDAKDDSKLLAKKETEAHAAVAKELLALSQYSVMKNAIDDAREVLDLGILIAPDQKQLQAAKDKLKDATKPAPKDYAQNYPGKKKAAYEKAAQALAAYMVFAGKHNVWDHFEEQLDILASKLGSEAAVAATGAVYFEPYRRWYNPADGKRLLDGGEKGTEVHPQDDTKWLDAKEVKALDDQHSTWSNPWVLADDVHELHTTMPVRTAKTLLLHVGEYRDMFVKYVADGWELRKPEGKLPIFVTATQKDFRDRMQADGHLKPGERINMAAVYCPSSRPLNPVYATFEPMDESGATAVMNTQYVAMILQHECTHQIATEYSMFDADFSGHGEKYQYWSVEGIATFMEVFRLGKTGWKLTHPNPKNHQEKASGNECAFAFCKDNLFLPETLKGFFDLTHDHFVRADHYQIAATVSYFLLEGEGKKYRKSFLKLLQLVHQSKDTNHTLQDCFPGVNFEQMHDEYKHFVGDMKLDEVEKAN